MLASRLAQGVSLRPKCELFIYSFCRKCSASQSKGTVNDQNTNIPLSYEGDYIPVYKFPYIRHISAFNRLKIYQGLLTTVGIPTSILLNQQGCVEFDFVMATTCLSLSICTILFGFGFLTNRLIGFIYINEKQESVKVAHLDFWGNRKEREIPLEDIVPLSYKSLNYGNSYYSYVPFQQYSEKKSLKLVYKFGQIVDEKKFDRIFLIDWKP